MKKRHKNIRFSFENEKDNSSHFLNVKICREKNKFVKSIFRKDRFSDVYTIVEVLQHLNTNLAQCKYFNMEVSQFCLIFPNVLQKLKHLRKHFVNNIFVQKPVFTIVPKLKLRIVFPYLGNVSSITKKILSRCISKRLKFCKLKIIFQSVNILKIYFRFKIVFLKPCNLTLSIGLSAEAAQLPITLKPTET